MNRIGLVLLLIFAAPAFAEPSGKPIPFNDERGHSVDSITVPPRSPVGFDRWLKGKSPVARFEGRFVLKGTYYYGDAANNNGPEFVGEAHIVPDRNTQLPQLVRRNGPLAIRIDNADIFAEAVIPASVFQRVRRKGGGYASGHVAIRVDGLTLGIVCDRPSYGTHFAAVYAPAGAGVTGSQPHFGC
jgi:hypothetical protein